MYGRARTGARFLAIAMLAPLAAACTTTVPTTTATPGKTDAPISAPTISLPRFTPTAYVDPALAQPCITAAANKYFLPEHAISAVNSVRAQPAAPMSTSRSICVLLFAR